MLFLRFNQNKYIKQFKNKQILHLYFTTMQIIADMDEKLYKYLCFIVFTWHKTITENWR